MPASYTPGPWRVCGGYTPAYSAIHSPEGYIVFGMADRLDHKEHGERIKAPDYETQRANVRLIAAAPELLAACRSLRRRLAELTGHDGDPDRWQLEIIKADEAIKKATGSA